MQFAVLVPGGTVTVGLGGGVVVVGVGLGAWLTVGVGLGVGDTLGLGDAEALGLGVAETDGVTDGVNVGATVGVGPGTFVGIPFTRQFRTNWKLPSGSCSSVDAGSHSTVGFSVVTAAATPAPKPMSRALIVRPAMTVSLRSRTHSDA